MNSAAFSSTAFSMSNKLIQAWNDQLNAPALGFKPNPRSETPISWLTYGELKSQALALADTLASTYPPGALIAIQMTPSYSWYLLDFAITLAGLTSVGLPLKTSDQDALLAKLKPAALMSALPPPVTWNSAKRDLDLPPRPDSEIACLVLTSGTGSTPKAVMISQVAWNARVDKFSPQEPPHWLSFQPPWHALDRTSVWSTLLHGGSVFVHNADHGISTLWDEFRAHNPTRIVASPRFFMALHQEWMLTGRGNGDELRSRFGTRIKSFSSSGGFCPPEISDFMSSVLGSSTKSTRNAYGSSEAGLVLSSGKVDIRNGVAVRLSPAPDSPPSTGELLVSSPQMCSGYYNDVNATDAAFTVIDGISWYRTGDLAEYRNGDGTYAIVDRRSNVVKLAQAEWVAPESLESKFKPLLPMVDEIILDARPGAEFVIALAFGNPGHLSPASLLRDVQAAGHSLGLSPWEIPRAVVVIDKKRLSAFLTGIGKKRRRPILATFKPELDRAYASISSAVAEESLKTLSDPSSTTRARLIEAALSLVLRRDPLSLPRAKPLASLGLDSLGAALVLSKLRSCSLSAIPSNSAALLASTINGLVESVISDANPAQEGSDVEDLCRSLPPRNPSQSQAPPSPSVVLITGAAGMVGSALISALFEQSSNVSIIALVRRLPCQPSSVHNPRLTFVVGDLDRPRLGLLPLDYAELQGKVKAVIHSGARVNHVLPYSALRQTNVVGTHAVLAFVLTAPHPVAYHHIGTTAPVRHSGYARSKAIAEKLVHEARIPYSLVYRVPFLFADSRTGVGNETDFVSRLMRAMMAMKLVPTEWCDATVSLTPSDWAASLIAHSVLSPCPDWGSTMVTLHPRHEVRMSQIVEAVRSYVPGTRSLVWPEFAEKLASHPSFAPTAHNLRKEGRTSAHRLPTVRNPIRPADPGVNHFVLLTRLRVLAPNGHVTARL